MAFSVDYTGRLIDLFISQGAKPVGEQPILYGFGEGSGEITSGIQKLVQKWVILFLTEEGTLEYHPTLGTRFLILASQGGLSDIATVRSEYELAAQTVRTVLKNLETDSTPADERLESAELTHVNINKAAQLLEMTVTITSEAGTQHDVLLPIPVPIQ